MCVRGPFPLTCPPLSSAPFPPNLFSPGRWRGMSPPLPLCKCYRFYPRTRTEGFPAQSVLKLLYIPPSLSHLIKIAALGSPILPAHHSALGEGARWAVLSDPLREHLGAPSQGAVFQISSFRGPGFSGKSQLPLCLPATAKLFQTHIQARPHLQICKFASFLVCKWRHDK